jgi:hypothetical protein
MILLFRFVLNAWRPYQRYSPTFRSVKKLSKVELVCVPLIKLELINRIDFLKGKILDPDEKVRAATCKVYSQIDFETALHHVSESQLRAVAGRGLDKKVWSRLSFVHFIKYMVSTADCADRSPQQCRKAIQPCLSRNVRLLSHTIVIYLERHKPKQR